MTKVIPIRKTHAVNSTANFAGLDAVRGFAALGVVFFHACVPYLQHPMPGLNWAVQDRTSGLVDFAFWWIELFIMPVFLIMAGFFAWKTLQSRGPVYLVRSRAKRLLKPLLFGALVILPIDLYLWVLGWVADGVVPAGKLRSLKFEEHLDEHLWGLSHLWFLQYLFLYVVVIAVVDTLRRRFDYWQRLALKPASAVGLIVLSGTLTLCWQPEVVWGFQHAFAPVAGKWIYSGCSFLMGVALAAYDRDLIWLQSYGRRLVAPAAICSGAAVLLGQWHLAGGESRLANLSLAALSCVSSTLITLSIFAIAVAKVRSVPIAVSYLAAASFWVYVVHHPILGLVHTDLKFVFPDTPPTIKTCLAFAITSGICLITYEAFVRTTSLGRWLGFAWDFPRSDDTKAYLAQSPPRAMAHFGGHSDGRSDDPRRQAA